MKTFARNIIKAILPYGVIILHRKYKDYVKLYKHNTIKKEFVFDICLSVGSACRPAHYLKKHGLRFCASPLDWMMRYSLDTVIYLYKTGFNDFFMSFIKDEEKGRDWYIDNKNNITSIHYGDIGNNSEAFRKMMKDRFKKINRMLLNAKNICFISNRNENIIVFERFLKDISGIYSGKITYINIRNNQETVVPTHHTTPHHTTPHHTTILNVIIEKYQKNWNLLNMNLMMLIRKVMI
jgi:hypothetical protein